ncbi:MAG: hypothetical protein ACREBN_02470 [Burkholderiaceae bacterium]
MRALAVVLVSILLAACSSSKTLSDGSILGVMTTQQLPVVIIDGQPMRLAPGARIYNSQNLSVTPGQVPPNTNVRYKLDASGQITQVWLLPATQ